MNPPLGRAISVFSSSITIARSVLDISIFIKSKSTTGQPGLTEHSERKVQLEVGVKRRFFPDSSFWDMELGGADSEWRILVACPPHSRYFQLPRFPRHNSLAFLFRMPSYLAGGRWDAGLGNREEGTGKREEGRGKRRV